MVEHLYAVGSIGDQVLVRCYNEKENLEVDISKKSFTGTKHITGFVELQSPDEE